MPRSEDPRDRVIRDACHVLDCLDHGYLPPDYVESECFARLRRSVEAHALWLIGQRAVALCEAAQPSEAA